MKITIATFNTAGVNFFHKDFYYKCKEITAIINEEELDIVNLQEVVLYKHLAYLKKLLPNYKYISYKPAIFGPLAGLATFSQIPLELDLFRKFDRNGDWYNISIIHKIAQRGMLLSKIKNSDIRVINTHFSSNMSNKWDIDNNYIKVLKSQSDNLYSILDSNGIKTAIITGDFNIPKSSNLYSYLIKKNLKDIFEDLYKRTHLGDLFFNKRNELLVDYIFIYNKFKKDVKILNRSYLFDKTVVINNKETYLSDHFGLEATISLL